MTLLGKWAMNLMLINVSTRKTAARSACRKAASARQAVRVCPNRRCPAASWRCRLHDEGMDGDGFVELDLLVIHIDGIHIKDDLMLLAAVGVDGKGGSTPRCDRGGNRERCRGAGLLENLIERGLDPKVSRLFVIDGAKALSKAIRKDFRRDTPIQRCQVHKARNIMERCPNLCSRRAQGVCGRRGTEPCSKSREASPQSCRCLDRRRPGVSGAILEGLDEILTVSRLACRRTAPLAGLDQHHREHERHDPLCRRNVKRWNDASMALRWTALP